MLDMGLFMEFKCLLDFVNQRNWSDHYSRRVRKLNKANMMRTFILINVHEVCDNG